MSEEDRSVFELVGRTGEEINPYGTHPDQIIEEFKPARPILGEIALIHGGYWRPEYDRVHQRPLAQALADAGWRVHLVEYRRVPGNPDTSIDDVKSALETIGHCVLIGHSAGGHLALIAQGHESVRGVVALAPVSDLVVGDAENYDDGAIREFLGVPATERLDLNPQSNPITKPTVVIHGTEDIRVPVAQSRNFLSAHPTAGYIELEETGHFELIDPRHDAFKLLINELKKFE
jgi:acetyl esterase/lipase